MCTKVAVLSGMGGSGKTIVAFSIAQFLAKDKSVLFVDCDIYSHGATYFFESMITEEEKIMSLKDFLSTEENLSVKPLSVMNNIDFIPSFLSYTDAYSQITTDDLISSHREELLSKYDVVIFDFHSGYSKICNQILNLTDINLLVSEANAIAASSIRVLGAKLQEHLKAGKTYLVFNKLIDFELSMFSDIKFEGVTVLQPLLFDWNIRKYVVMGIWPKFKEKSNYSSFDDGITQIIKNIF